MEHRKDCAGPREMLDDCMLQRLLNDMAEDKGASRSGCGCGNDRSASARQPVRSPEHAERNGPCSSCGHSNQVSSFDSNGCGCREKDSCRSTRNVPQLQGFPLSMIYSPEQVWENLFEPEEALEKGTLFAGLVFPWYPSRCRENRDCGCGRG
ncbi:MAG: spore coat associated protein CotJA [Clostridia bacterium]|nr:spore coat associated protein CotJA [Clostridia bacterium]